MQAPIVSDDNKTKLVVVVVMMNLMDRVKGIQLIQFKARDLLPLTQTDESCDHGWRGFYGNSTPGSMMTLMMTQQCH